MNIGGINYASFIKDFEVYYYSDPAALNGNTEPHYWICAKNHIVDKILIIAVSTTQSEKTQKRLKHFNRKSESVVIVSENTTPFKKQCLIDCNYTMLITHDEFNEKIKEYKNNTKFNLGLITDTNVREAVINGILLSDDVENLIKKYIDPNFTPPSI